MPAKRLLALVLTLLMVFACIIMPGCLNRANEQAEPNPVPQAENPKALQKEDTAAQEKRLGAEAGEPDVNDYKRIVPQLTKKVRQAAEDVEGVERAHVVVIGETALIGLYLGPNPTAEAVAEIRDQVGFKIKDEVAAIDVAIITTEPKDVERIRTIESNIAKGMPLSNYLEEISTIIKPRDTANDNQTVTGERE